MPHHKACKKHVRTSSQVRAKNRTYRTQLRGLIREVRESEESAQAKDKFHSLSSLLDRLARKGIIHKNRASSAKSRLSRHIEKLSN